MYCIPYPIYISFRKIQLNMNKKNEDFKKRQYARTPAILLKAYQEATWCIWAQRTSLRPLLIRVHKDSFLKMRQHLPSVPTSPSTILSTDHYETLTSISAARYVLTCTRSPYHFIPVCTPSVLYASEKLSRYSIRV